MFGARLQFVEESRNLLQLLARAQRGPKRRIVRKSVYRHLDPTHQRNGDLQEDQQDEEGEIKRNATQPKRWDDAPERA